jgi:hypothetical protein
VEWDFYWKPHPDGPFATLIRVATTYLHPEADDLAPAAHETGRSRTNFARPSTTQTRSPATSSPATSSTTTAVPRSSYAGCGATSSAASRFPGPGQG